MDHINDAMLQEAKPKPACRRAVRIPRKPPVAPSPAEPLKPPVLSPAEPRTEQRKPPAAGSMSSISPMRSFSLTGADVKSELKAARGSCSVADLFLERYQQTHDEYMHELEELGTSAYEAAREYMGKFEYALEQLESVEIETPPPQAAWLDKTILAEVEATRTNLNDAMSRCRATMICMMEALAEGNERGQACWHEDESGDVTAAVMALQMMSASPSVGQSVAFPGHTANERTQARRMTWE